MKDANYFKIIFLDYWVFLVFAIFEAGAPNSTIVKINDIIPSAGAGFLVAISGDIMRMPGLPKRPAAVNMDIDEDGKIIGLF